MKKIMKKLLVISPFPSKNSSYDNPYSALASYAKNTIEGIRKSEKDVKIIVLADKYPGGYSWKSKNLTVSRVWQRNDYLLYWQLLHKIIKYRDSSVILLEVEWNLFGKNILLLGFLPLFVLLLKSMGKKIIPVIHGISLDFTDISPQIGLKRNAVLTKIFSFFLVNFYKNLIRGSYVTVVLEKHFADTLNKFFKTNKAVFIPHGVDTSIPIKNKATARKKLKIRKNIFLILNFGFLNWYKGSDIIIKLFQQAKKLPLHSHLVLAGGESRIHKVDEHYNSYMMEIKKRVQKLSKVTVTGFLGGRKMADYFAASDIVVLPYRVFISSSGPLSLAFSYKKPFLLSRSLRNYFKSPDFKKAAVSAGLIPDDIIFKLDSDDFSKKINLALKNLKKMKYFATLLREQRNWQIIAGKYIRILHLALQ